MGVYWQEQLFAEILSRLPPSADSVLVGSAIDRTSLDGWSDLDIKVRLEDDISITALAPSGQVWAVDDVLLEHSQTCRLILKDGRRIDISVSGEGHLVDLPQRADNEFRFIAGIAAAKLGRGDRLIGLHLTFELFRMCLVEAMLLRDLDIGTTVHRHGTRRDEYAEELLDLVAGSSGQPTPQTVARTADVYGRWRAERERNYQPDWSGLTALIRLGEQSTS